MQQRIGEAAFACTSRPLQENANLAELTLTGGYYKNLEGKIVITMDDFRRLGLENRIEIAIGVGEKPWSLAKDEPAVAMLSATVTELSDKKGANHTFFPRRQGYKDYVNIAARFREINATGNLLIWKEHTRGLELTVGHTLFLKIQKVIQQP